jgi:hypothetical protein
MSLIGGDTCNGQDPGGCSQPAPAVPVEQFPFGLAVDRMGGWGVSIGLDGSASTGYVSDNVDGTVSMFELKR